MYEKIYLYINFPSGLGDPGDALGVCGVPGPPKIRKIRKIPGNQKIPEKIRKIRKKTEESGKKPENNWKNLERNQENLEKNGSPMLPKNVLAHSVSNFLKSTIITGSETPRNPVKKSSANLSSSTAHGLQILGSTCTVHVMHGFTLVYTYIFRWLQHTLCVSRTDI